MTKEGRDMEFTANVLQTEEAAQQTCERLSGYCRESGMDQVRSMYVRLLVEELLELLRLSGNGQETVIQVSREGEDVITRLCCSGETTGLLERLRQEQPADRFGDWSLAVRSLKAALDVCSETRETQCGEGQTELYFVMKPRPVLDYLCEKRLQELDPVLHGIFCRCTPVINAMLDQYHAMFQNWPDHSYIHAVGVINQCNQLIGQEIYHMNADEIFILLEGALFHDTGMGVSQEDFRHYLPQLNEDLYAGLDPEQDARAVIRACHHELSALVVMDRWQEIGIPTERYAMAVAKVASGHRKTDLMDARLFPSDFEVAPGRTVCLPYLSALIRYADELDIGDGRLLCEFDDETMNRKDWMERNKHNAIRSVEIKQNSVEIMASAEEPEVRDGVCDMVEEIRKKAKYCADAVEKRTSFRLRQREIKLIFI